MKLDGTRVLPMPNPVFHADNQLCSLCKGFTPGRTTSNLLAPGLLSNTILLKSRIFEGGAGGGGGGQAHSSSVTI